ncbi:BamA/TamA family outer membrane protein [Archangium sp.]|uniref:BamA/TamA family outer membrane protein n=1 Tax=Archangium sp. TaxID=1872627 RepID=UPI002D42AEC5|nr:BamA/TamA family outer membrane protein [Archangium sp.]HYO55678.1 BamA/TamA family outer membrane protein [Archangium sp.]
MSLACPTLIAAFLLAAEPAPPTESYEDALVQWGLALEGGRTPEPDPEGKRLESVLVASEDVVAPSDPYPLLLNVFHMRTREGVIRREVLLEPGEPYSSELALETARNLRKLGIFAVVRVVPVRGSTPDAVSLLIITKDLWSLRLNQEFQVVGSLVQFLRLQGTEQNFLGRNKKVALDFILRRDSLSFGQTYVDPRLGGSRWSLNETAALILGRENGRLEGSKGSVLVTRPFYALNTPWSFQAQAAWRVQPVRVFRGAEVWELPYPEGGTVPYVYDARELSGSVLYLRSWGSRYKLDAGVGVGAYHRRYGASESSGLDEARRAWLRDNHLPRSEDATYVLAYARFWETRYEVMRDVDSYALSEDFQVGHYLTATARYAPALLASAGNFAEVGLTARYRVRLGDALTSLTAAASVRRILGGEGQGTWTNRRWVAELQQVSPKVLGGRFVVRGLLDVNIDDLNERVLLLGGDNGLRGARPEAYSGKRMALLNVEYRTPPLILYTVHLGGVLFYDAGSAFERSPGFVHSVGVGLRLFFPQFNIAPFRFDFGYILNDERPEFGGRFSFGGGQVTGFRPGFLEAPL